MGNPISIINIRHLLLRHRQRRMSSSDSSSPSSATTATPRKKSRSRSKTTKSSNNYDLLVKKAKKSPSTDSSSSKKNATKSPNHYTLLAKKSLSTTKEFFKKSLSSTKEFFNKSLSTTKGFFKKDDKFLMQLLVSAVLLLLPITLLLCLATDSVQRENNAWLGFIVHLYIVASSALISLAALLVKWMVLIPLYLVSFALTFPFWLFCKETAVVQIATSPSLQV